MKLSAETAIACLDSLKYDENRLLLTVFDPTNLSFQSRVDIVLQIERVELNMFRVTKLVPENDEKPKMTHVTSIMELLMTSQIAQYGIHDKVLPYHDKVKAIRETKTMPEIVASIHFTGNNYPEVWVFIHGVTKFKKDYSCDDLLVLLDLVKENRIKVAEGLYADVDDYVMRDKEGKLYVCTLNKSK